MYSRYRNFSGFSAGVLIFIVLFLSLSCFGEFLYYNISTQQSGVLRVEFIDLVIDSSGLVSVSERFVVRGGDIVSIMVPDKVDNLRVSDSFGRVFSYETVSRGNNMQLVSFFLDESYGSESMVYLTYSTQHLTSKQGDLWNISFCTSATPFITTIRVTSPGSTRIVGIDFRGFNWAPEGDSVLLVYPVVEDLCLSFTYKLGVSGPMIPKPTRTVSTTSTVSTTVVSGVGSYGLGGFFSSYLFMVVIFVVLVLFSVLFLMRKRGSSVDSLDVGSDLSSGVSSGLGSSNSSSGPVSSGGGGSESVGANGSVSAVGSDVGGVVFDYDVVSDASVVEVGVGERVRRVKDSVLNVLDVNERRVVELLECSDGEITQAFIYKSTGIPKSSLSDTIKRLEKRNIIERKKDGRINWIKLKDWVFS